VRQLRGVLIELPRSSSRRPRPHAVRKAKEYRAIRPGDLAEIDTLDVHPLPGVIGKHFTAREVISRWDVPQAHRPATAATGTQFLDRLQPRMPFRSMRCSVTNLLDELDEFNSLCSASKAFILELH
jgi:putative transposase